MTVTKEYLLRQWGRFLKSKEVKKTFKQMVIGRHDSVGDGWRKMIYMNDEHCYVEIILERNPSGYIIYCNDNRFQLGKGDLYEKMCIDFDIEIYLNTI